MTAAETRSRHPSRGELLRRLDGELGPEAEGRVQWHLERCGACRERAERLERDARAAHLYLRDLRVMAQPDPARRERARLAVRAAAASHRRSWRTRTRGLAVAAAVAGLLVVSFSVDPVRAWVLQRLSAPLALRPHVSEEVAELPRTVVGADGSIVAFEVADETFRLHVDHPQTGGDMLLQVSGSGRATAQVTRSSDETMMVLPSGLRIENRPASRASYRVTLPTSVRQVSLQVGAGETVVIPVPPEASWSRRVPLQR